MKTPSLLLCMMLTGCSGQLEISSKPTADDTQSPTVEACEERIRLDDSVYPGRKVAALVYSVATHSSSSGWYLHLWSKGGRIHKHDVRSIIINRDKEDGLDYAPEDVKAAIEATYGCELPQVVFLVQDEVVWVKPLPDDPAEIEALIAGLIDEAAQ